MSELKPCPGCGRDDSEDNACQCAALVCRDVLSPVGPAFEVSCACGFIGPRYVSRADAIAAWNRRTPVSTAPREPVEAEPVADVAQWQIKGPDGDWLSEDSDLIPRRREQGYLVRPLYLAPPASEIEALRKQRDDALASLAEVHKAEHPSDTRAFKNFHRSLCERFEYTHDERDWRRDQVSLIEWISSRIAVLEASLAEHKKALEPFAKIADQEDRLRTPSCESVFVNVDHLRAARRVRDGGKV